MQRNVANNSRFTTISVLRNECRLSLCNVEKKPGIQASQIISSKEGIVVHCFSLYKYRRSFVNLLAGRLKKNERQYFLFTASVN